jgi:hypothetical protein
MRWKLEMGEFDFLFRYIKGKDNVVADAMSRLLHDEEEFKEEKRMRDELYEKKNRKLAFLGALLDCNSSRTRRPVTTECEAPYSGKRIRSGDCVSSGQNLQSTAKRGRWNIANVGSQSTLVC